MSIEVLNQKALEMVNRYMSLDIGGRSVACPYFSNNVGVEYSKLLRKAEIPEDNRQKFRDLVNERKLNYGWFKGKGTPEQIELATEGLAKKNNTDLAMLTEDIIRNFMLVVGVGIDNPGFIYQVLLSAFNDIGLKSEFKDSLNWSDENNKKPSRAGTSIFTSPATKNIDITEAGEMDLVLNMQEKSEHVGILVKMNEQMYLAHSTISREKAGVVIEPVNLEGRETFFDPIIDSGGNLQRFMDAGHFEFRRLNILK